jgi:hypothetical protein
MTQDFISEINNKLKAKIISATEADQMLTADTRIRAVLAHESNRRCRKAVRGEPSRHPGNAGGRQKTLLRLLDRQSVPGIRDIVHAGAEGDGE